MGSSKVVVMVSLGNSRITDYEAPEQADTSGKRLEAGKQ